MCKESAGPITVAGIQLGMPVDALLPQLGPPIERRAEDHWESWVAKYQHITLKYLQHDNTLTVLDADVGAPLGDLFPGVRFGSDRITVQAALAKLGYCDIAYNESSKTLTVTRNGQNLLLEFDGDNLSRVRLERVAR